MSMPIIHIQLEGIREAIQYAFLQRSDEFNAGVEKALNKVLSVEYIEAKIENEVTKAVDNAIKSLSENYVIQQIVREIVSKALANKLENMEG
jgi:hypothetical protein